MLTFIGTVLALAAMLFGGGTECNGFHHDCQGGLTVAQVRQAWKAERGGGGQLPDAP